MKELNKCDCCGKFKPWNLLFSMGNGDEEWFECNDCISNDDRERFGLES